MNTYQYRNELEGFAFRIKLIYIEKLKTTKEIEVMITGLKKLIV